MAVIDFSDSLDDLASMVFSGDEGKARLQPLLRRYEADVIDLRPDEPEWERLQAARMDWALCEAEVPGAAPGETWAWRAAHDRIEGIDVKPAWLPLARSVVGLFEIWPGTVTWLRDRISGICVSLSGPHRFFNRPGRSGPAGLWEARLVWTENGVQFVREPIEYPHELLEFFEKQRSVCVPGQDQELSLLKLRRLRIHWMRANGRVPFDHLMWANLDPNSPRRQFAQLRRPSVLKRVK